MRRCMHGLPHRLHDVGARAATHSQRVVGDLIWALLLTDRADPEFLYGTAQFRRDSRSMFLYS